MDNESLPGEKNDLAEQIFANISLLKRYKLVPVPNDKLFVCPETKYVLSEEQTKVCKSCNQRYSSSLFEESSNVCLLCQKLNSVEYIENSQYLKKAFYERKYGPKEDFKAYCTMNTLMLKYNHSNGSQLDIFHFNTKKGKYVLVKDLQKEAK